MIKTIFHTPCGDIIENIDLETMRRYLIDEFNSYWSQGSGDGFIDYYVDNHKISTMMLGPNEEYGIYLHVIDYKSDEEWLSIYNKNLLEEVVETADEIYASVGLFLPLGLAWQGVECFLIHGDLSKKINWSQPDIIPDGGNW